MRINYRDMLFKMGWTCLQAGLSYLLVASAGWSGTWVVPITAALTMATAWVRQMTGTTPPPAEAVDAVDMTRGLAWRDRRAVDTWPT